MLPCSFNTGMTTLICGVSFSGWSFIVSLPLRGLSITCGAGLFVSPELLECDQAEFLRDRHNADGLIFFAGGEGYFATSYLTIFEGPESAEKGLEMRRIFLVNTLFLIIFSGLPGVSLGAGLDLSAHQGKVVIVDFWASWCVPCRRSFPWMNAMQAKYEDQGLVIIAVNMDADGNEAADFLREYPADFEIVYDPDGELAREYDVIAMPSSYVFDRQGKQIARHLGFKVSKQDEYESTLAEALSQ